MSASDAGFVGDDPRWDVAGAEQAGLHPILLAPGGSTTLPDPIPVAKNLREVSALLFGSL